LNQPKLIEWSSDLFFIDTATRPTDAPPWLRRLVQERLTHRVIVVIAALRRWALRTRQAATKARLTAWRKRKVRTGRAKHDAKKEILRGI
jgi:hypothetical protein